MSGLEKQVIALHKRVNAMENQLKQDSNLMEIKKMLADISRIMSEKDKTNELTGGRIFSSAESSRIGTPILNPRYRSI